MTATTTKDTRLDAGQVLSAIFGAPLVAFVVGAALTAFLPVSPELALAVGAHTMVPLWVALACALPLMKSGRAAWALCLGLVVPLATLLVLRRLA